MGLGPPSLRHCGGVISAIVNETSPLWHTSNNFLLDLPIWGGRIELFLSTFAHGASSHVGLLCVFTLQSAGEVRSLLWLRLWSRYAPMFTIGAIPIFSYSYDNITQVLFHALYHKFIASGRKCYNCCCSANNCLASSYLPSSTLFFASSMRGLLLLGLPVSVWETVRSTVTTCKSWSGWKLTNLIVSYGFGYYHVEVR